MSTSTSSTWTDADVHFMGLAMEQGQSALGRVAPNPGVGAIVVRDGKVVGSGATQPPPGQHGEKGSLAEAGELAKGATMYATLEPCSHYGRTPPCTDVIIAAGIARVVVGVVDPYPEVNGRGIAQLREAGITVDVGCRADEITDQIAGFISRVMQGRPRTILKYAMTLDGRIATAAGNSRWISGPESRQYVHQLRDRSDAILVGIGTALADDPQLTTRIPDDLAGYGGVHHPLRVVLDSQLRLPPKATMLAEETPGQTLIYTLAGAPIERKLSLEAAGAQVVRVGGTDGRVALTEVMTDLAERGINDVLIEGGASVFGDFFDQGLADDLKVFIAPKLVGGCDAPGPVGGPGVQAMADAWQLERVRISQLGSDLLVEGHVVRDGEVG